MKNVLITGALGGMGKATCKLLLEKGYNVIGVDVKENADIPITYYKVDLTNANQIKQVYERVVNGVKKLDAIIHFAGVYKMDSLIEIEEERLVEIFNINLFGIYRINKIFKPLLDKGSKIIITSSELAPLDPLPFTGIYAITKSSVEKYAYSLKMELQLLGIDVSVIRPGAVKTDILNVSISELDALCDKTTLYKTNAKRFKKIVESVENKNIAPIKIAKKAYKILNTKRAKFVYNVNRNFLLRLLNILPKRLQLYIIKRILIDK